MGRSIVIKGAREHNLRNISLTIPRNQFVVFTGLSGSGKSSLAFDTIYAEGQRRYLESLSAYARQFMEQMRKPDVDSIEGLSPSISIEQKNISRNPRSTVGTVTEIYDFLRLLYARIGLPHCYSCGKPIQSQSVQQITQLIMEEDQGTRFAVLAPIIRGKKGEYQKELLDLRSKGFVRALIDGEEVSLSFPVRLKKNLKHDISIYVDRLVIKPGVETRLAEALEIAIDLAGGLAEIEIFQEKTSTRKFFSTQFACPECGISFPELEPRNFSFNSPHGACPQCSGIGSQPKIDPGLVVPNENLSLLDGAIAAWADKSRAWQERVFQAIGETFKFSADTPWNQLPDKAKEVLLYGSKGQNVEFKVSTKGTSHTFIQEFRGIIPPLEEALKDPEEMEDDVEAYVVYQPCSLCNGTRLKLEATFVYVDGISINALSNLNIVHVKERLAGLKLKPHETTIATPILKEINARLAFLENVGLSYLTLARAANTLSGGESQRIRLASQIGSGLVGVVYVLDEPSIGLHQRDNEKLIITLEKLRDQGNSVLVVEHDEETIMRADYVVDLGPGAGRQGGELVFAGTPAELMKSSRSLTGQFLSGEAEIEVPKQRRPVDTNRLLSIEGATANNLKSVSVNVPLGLLVCVTGVSGSGKSTLVLDTLLVAMKEKLAGRNAVSLPLQKISGLDQIDKVIHVDQSPIGRTPRSNPATFTGVFSDIRTLFAQLPDSKARGYKPGRFSFNVEGGRCEACTGDGAIKMSMHFLPDVFVPCEICRGKRYGRETLEITYRGKSIADVLAMTIEEAFAFFQKVPIIRGKLQTLLDVGLAYIQVGQSAVTLSGGEAQRIKLARELNRRATGRTLYILDEPTTGLHFEDVRKLLEILQTLVSQGNTVLVIEHNLDVIKQADQVIDLGPEGGEGGGEILFQGTPEELSNVAVSYTGKFLKQILGRIPKASASKSGPKTLLDSRHNQERE